jgi:[protein-PII] uridylyltransferase
MNNTTLLDSDAIAEVGGKRAIVHRAALQAELAKIAEASLPQGEQRARALDLFRGALDKGRAEVKRRFLEGEADGHVTVRANCFLIDQLLRVLFDHATQRLYPLPNPSTGARLSMVATGGYGRGELAPFSDVDLLFIYPYKLTARSEQVIEEMLYFLWDLGLKVGHAARSLDDCLRQAKADVTIRTSMLEMRYLWGDQELYQEFKKRYQEEIQGKDPARFIEAKLAERDIRHKKHGSSRYILEPNIKEGKGGLRDLHTLFWIAKDVYRVDDIGRLVEKGVFTRAEVRKFEKAQEFLWSLRCQLHYESGRAEERLTFDLQKAIAEKMGYTAHAGTQEVERLMKHYFLVAKDVGDLTRIFCSALEAQHNRSSRFRLLPLARRRSISGFPVEGDRLNVKGPETFETEPRNLLRIFKLAQENDLDIHPQALQLVTRKLKLINKALREDKEANRLFLDMLTSRKDPETTLRRLNEAGVFGRFLPDFGRVVAQMQYNMYHHYTVDEHTIYAIGILHAIEEGRLKEEAPIASEVVHKVLSREVLYTAVLLHDIAKGRPGDHSIVGAEVAEKVCPRLGLSAEETETVSWLVRFHLLMSDTAFRRDINDAKTIRDFADKVQSMERLRLLLVLTVADIRAVGPGTWTAWKAALLRDLYWQTEEVLAGGFATEGREARVEQAKQALRDALTDWDEKEVEEHLKRGYASYWLSCDTPTHLHHAQLVREAEARGQPLTIDTRVDEYREATEVTVYTADHPGLFSRITGAMAVAGASIEAARIFTLSNGMALDVFWVRAANGDPFDRPDKIARLSANIERSLEGKLRPLTELKQRQGSIPNRLKVFRVPPRVLVDNKASNRHTIIEVNGRDRPGILFQVTLALSKLGLIIHSAMISTYGVAVVDVFYVRDALGGKITDEGKLKRIREKLMEALRDPECKPEEPKKTAKKKRAAASRSKSRNAAE